jgi:hypothetical protein
VKSELRGVVKENEGWVAVFATGGGWGHGSGGSGGGGETTGGDAWSEERQ